MTLRTRLPWLEQFWQDAGYALRQLARAKGFTVVVVLTLALGIGATTAIYSVVNTVLFNPVPGPDADRVVQIGEHTYMGQETTLTMVGMSPQVLEAVLQGGSELFSDLAWADANGGSFELKGDDFTTAVSGCAMSPNLFALFGARPLLGRTFAMDEAVPLNPTTRMPDRDATIMLSHTGWQSQFASRRDVVGQTIELSGKRYTVIGVMPAWFQFPFPGIKFWVSAQPLRIPANRGVAGNIRVIVRLKPGVEVAQMQAMLDTLAQRLSKEPTLAWKWKRNDQLPSGLSLWARPLRDTLLGYGYGRGSDDVRRTLFALMAAIGFVLLIACANVANLMLARTERRQHELAIRAALGAGRGRLTRQLLAESVLLAGLGAVGGLFVTAWGMKVLMVLNTMPRLRPVEVNGQALAIALVVALVTALAFGLVPAWRGARPRLSETLAQGGAGMTAAVGGRRYRSVLVVVQVALAVVLLAGAGLMIQSVVRLLRVDPGYDPENMLVVIPAKLNWGGARNEERIVSRNLFYEQVRERFSAVPGVTAVGIWKSGAWTERITVDGRVEPLDVYRGGTGVEASDYFRMARVPLLAGRYLEQRDVGGTGTVIVTESMARLCWPGEPAVGKRFRSERGGGDKMGETLYEVVGVVGDTRTYKYDAELQPTFYRPLQEASLVGAPVWVVVRTAIDPALAMPLLRQELKVVEPGMRMPSIQVTRQTLYDATQPRRTYRNFMVAFAGTGLLLSALGIYGVLAYSVARRTREIGIRIAIGADRRAVLSLIMGEGARLVATGMGVGLLAAFWLTRLLQKQLFGVSPHEPVVFATVIGVLAAVALIACWLPARRAAKVDPLVALRAE